MNYDMFLNSMLYYSSDFDILFLYKHNELQIIQEKSKVILHQLTKLPTTNTRKLIFLIIYFRIYDHRFYI